jgi:hypothetical protein
MAYTYGKVMQVHPLAFPSGKLPYYFPFTEKNFDLTRDLQVAFHPGTVAFNDGYAHTDYGPWSGETRLVEFYGDNQPGVEQAYRTVHLARGERHRRQLPDHRQRGSGAGCDLRRGQWSDRDDHRRDFLGGRHPSVGGAEHDRCCRFR